MDDDEDIRKVIKNKVGADLFRELLRHNPNVVVEDYYKHGAWQDATMRLDIEILSVHRIEAGAPDLLPISEVPMPNVPVAPPKVNPGVRPVITPVGTPQVVQAPGEAKVVEGFQVGLSADLQHMARFITKWQFDPARCRPVLSRLSPERRLYVMHNFTYVPADGPCPNARLDEYISECELTDAWSQLDGGAGAEESEAVVVEPPAKRLNLGEDNGSNGNGIVVGAQQNVSGGVPLRTGPPVIVRPNGQQWQKA
eukprot:TRINITY_DN1678_c1_g2_i1.p2 TRINITY_DN1678_c1_g2~~TRINITY_DN1678_c1_g2_i1.p2  ORF type:complete len:253 (+),score=49.27 TRINITY_DN1678_c1_g2_i1:36-794(+)